MKKNPVIICFSLFLIAIIGCASNDKLSPRSQSADISKRPGWTMNIPEEPEKLYFVGISKFVPSESDARSGAMKSAKEQVAEYLGSEVQSKFKEASRSYGLSSQVVDPKKLELKFREQISEKLVELVKDKKWYLERETAANGMYAYKSFVLATVTLSTVNDHFKNMANTKKDEAIKKAEEANTESTKELWESSLKMWKDLDNEDFFK